MKPSREDPARSSSSSSSSPTHNEEGKVVTEPTDNDVLLGRGIDHKGNVQFRGIISSRRDEYLNVRKRQQKDWIARQVMSAVAKKGGRFLKRIESEEAQQLGLPARKPAWKVADMSSILLKIKQALRERESEQAGKRQAGDPSPMPTKRHQPDTSLQRFAVPLRDNEQRSSIGQIPVNTGHPSEMKISSEGLSTRNPDSLYTATLLREVYDRLQQQGSNREPSVAIGSYHNVGATPSDSEQVRSVLRNEYFPGANRYPSISSGSGQTSLDILLASLPGQGQPKNFSSSTAPFASPLMAGNQTLHQAAHTSIQFPDVAALEMNQAPVLYDATFTPNNDRIRALLATLQGSDAQLAQLDSGHTSFPVQEEKVTPGRTAILGGIGLQQQQQQRPGRLIPSFFPADIQAETKGIVVLCNSMNLDQKLQEAAYLSFSLTEMLILSVLCSFGIPVWNPSKLDQGEVFSPVKTSTSDGPSTASYHFSWFDFSLLLQEAAKDWRDRRYQIHGILTKIRSGSDDEGRAIDICAWYSMDCRKLAKTSLCILEKVRCFLEAMHGDNTGAAQKVADRRSGNVLTSWMEDEIKHWAETLECNSSTRFPVAYTSSDFLVSHPGYKENSAFKLVSHCSKEACETIWNQIGLLSHTRSLVTAVPSVDILAARLEKSLVDKRGQSWEGMPRWWSLNTSYFDVELLKIVLLDGYVGILSAPLCAPPAAASLRYNEMMTFSKLGITSKSLLHERFEQMARLLAEVDSDKAFLEQIQQPRSKKCLEERIQTFQSLA